MTPQRRKTLAAAGVAVAAGAAGLWMGIWRRGSHDEGATPSALWTTDFAGLDGKPLRLAAFKGRPLLLNFWASWCAPCVKEMPLLDRFHQQQGPAGWQVVGLALDREAAVREFLRATPVRFPIALAGLDGSDLMASLGNRQGGLPFTLVIDAQGRVRDRRLGETHEEDLRRWAGAGALLPSKN
jgi:thiol-disulfide isomerase/thioredoxin